MPNKELKKVMTDLAAGHITQAKADELLGKKPAEDSMDKKTQTRKLNPKKKILKKQETSV